MNKTVMRVVAKLERVTIRQDEKGAACQATFQFPQTAASNGWVTIEIEEAVAIELRRRVGKMILFTLEDT